MATHKDYFESLCDISRALASAEKRDALLSRIVRSAVEVMDAKAACLFLKDPETDTFVPAAHTGFSPDYLHVPQEMAAQQVDNLKVSGFMFIKDVATDGRYANQEAKQAEGIASTLTVPVSVNNKIIGILSLYTAVPRDFSNGDIKFLTALAEQGAMAIDRLRLVTQVRRNARMFRDLSAVMNASLDIAAIMRVMTEEVAGLLNAKGVTIRLADEESHTLRLTASYGLSEAYLNKGDVYEDKGIAEAMNGKTIVITDVAETEGVLYRDEKRSEGIVTILTVPICVKHDVIGVLRLYFGTRREFYEDEIMTVEALGHQGGLAIQNAFCYLRLESGIKDLKDNIWTD